MGSGDLSNFMGGFPDAEHKLFLILWNTAFLSPCAAQSRSPSSVSLTSAADQLLSFCLSFAHVLVYRLRGVTAFVYRRVVAVMSRLSLSLAIAVISMR